MSDSTTVLDEFITLHRDAIIEAARERVASRANPRPTEVEINQGIPVFLDQLCVALKGARSSNVVNHEAISKSASEHGRHLFSLGLTVAQVVHGYGDVCQVVTALVTARHAAISSAEFQTLNLCLDDAIAAAVTEYASGRERTMNDETTERLGMLAHELRNSLNAAMLSFDSIQKGRVAPSGSTAQVHSRSLVRMRDLIDRSLAEVRLEAGIERLDPISVAELVGEVEVSAAIQAQSRAVTLHVTSVDRTVTVRGDREILAAVLANLLQNAFKFTRKNGNVTLTIRATAEHVFFDVEDECGGLPPGKTEELFQPFVQLGADRSGVGLGLAICRKGAKASGGELFVRDLPGKGCVFTLQLPRLPPPPLSLVDSAKRKAG